MKKDHLTADLTNIYCDLLIVTDMKWAGNLSANIEKRWMDMKRMWATCRLIDYDHKLNTIYVHPKETNKCDDEKEDR